MFSIILTIIIIACIIVMAVIVFKKIPVLKSVNPKSSPAIQQMDVKRS